MLSYQGLRRGCICSFLTATPTNVDMTSFHRVLLHFIKNWRVKQNKQFIGAVFCKLLLKTAIFICQWTQKLAATLQPLSWLYLIKPAISAFLTGLHLQSLLQPRCKVNATAIFSTCYKRRQMKLLRGCSKNATPALKKIGKCEIALYFLASSSAISFTSNTVAF